MEDVRSKLGPLNEIAKTLFQVCRDHENEEHKGEVCKGFRIRSLAIIGFGLGMPGQADDILEFARSLDDLWTLKEKQDATANMPTSAPQEFPK